MKQHRISPAATRAVEATKHALSGATRDSHPIESMPNDSAIIATENVSDVWLLVHPNSDSSGAMKIDQA